MTHTSSNPLACDRGYLWRLTSHARKQACARGVTVKAVMTTLSMPEFTYPGRAGRIVYWRGGIKVVADPRQRLVITVAPTRTPIIA